MFSVCNMHAIEILEILRSYIMMLIGMPFFSESQAALFAQTVSSAILPKRATIFTFFHIPLSKLCDM